MFVAWFQQKSLGFWVMRVAYSADCGSMWTPAPGINVSNNSIGEAGKNSDVVTDAISDFGIHCYVAWQYMSGTTNQIYFSSSELGSREVHLRIRGASVELPGRERMSSETCNRTGGSIILHCGGSRGIA
jgi:hypothetical protein